MEINSLNIQTVVINLVQYEIDQGDSQFYVWLFQPNNICGHISDSLMLAQQLCCLQLIKYRKKSMDFTAKLHQIAKTMRSQETLQKVLKNAKKNLVFSEKDFRSLNSDIILQLFAIKTLTKVKPSNNQRDSNEQSKCLTFQIFWHPNEFKIFVWISVCYAYISNREIQEFNAEDLSFLHAMFPLKKMIFLEYNIRCLLKQDRSTKQGWCQQQINLLCNIIKLENLKGKWSDISFSLFQKSEKKYFRSSHKCREKWYNHLDPSVKHTKWTLQEDYRLFQLVSQMGTRWASISKGMSGKRTEHMVKNRYNSLYKKYGTRFQRYAIKKLIDIILKDLKKKMENESKEEKQQEKYSQQSSLQKQEQVLSNNMQTEQFKCESVEAEPDNQNLISSTNIRIQDFLNTSLLLPQWESFEFEQICHSSFDDMDPYRSMYLKEKIELIDYCSLEIEPYKNHFLE